MTPAPGLLKVELSGSVNVGDAAIREHIARNIQRPLPQAKPHAPNPYEVAIVGGGASLADTVTELRDLVFRGCKVVALNGSAAWLVERNIRPHMHVLLDARASNARFLEPEIPGCKVFLASQCHPDLFVKAEGRDVTIWHVVSAQDEPLLHEHYSGHYHAVGGGTTVALRAIALLRMLGFQRMHLFGIDSCWLNGQHHAYPQPENDTDIRKTVYLVPRDPVTGEQRFDLKRAFVCDPWMMQQANELQQMIRGGGHLFKLQIHGDGLLANILTMGADLAEG